MKETTLQLDPTQPLTLEESRIQMGKLIGLDEPVPEAVLLAALNDSTYAHHLLVCRETPAFLRHLLNHPPPPPAAQPSASLRENAGNVELARRAAVALWKWGRAGFTSVDQDTYDRRLEACMQCEYLSDPPKRTVYKLLTSQDRNGKTCSLCGCVVAKKARLPTENCPSQHPTKAGLTRWQEPL